MHQIYLHHDTTTLLPAFLAFYIEKKIYAMKQLNKYNGNF